MAYFVYTAGHGDERAIIGGSVDIDYDEALHIADRATAEVGEKVAVQEVPVFTPQPVQVGDIVSAATAMTLTRGSGVIRVSTDDGVEVKPVGVLVRAPGGYRGGTTDDELPGPLRSGRFRVLHIGQPWDGPASTAARR